MVLSFNKKESLVVYLTIFLVALVTYLNLLTSFRRARDVQRKGDLRSIYQALVAYQIDVASFPHSENGRIKACDAGLDENGILTRRECVWGEDGLRDIFYDDPSYPDYIETLPDDPHKSRGVEYAYLSNGRHFQLFAWLEGGQDESGFNADVVKRNIQCGTKICNYAISDGETPLDISVEEYENILRMRKLDNSNLNKNK